MKSFLITCAFAACFTFAYGGTRDPFGGGGSSRPSPFGGDDTPVAGETFRVSQVNAINRPKLLTLFQECQKHYVVMEGIVSTRADADLAIKTVARAAKSREVADHAKEISKGLVEDMVVFQRIGAREFLIKTNGGREIAHLETLDDMDAFDGYRVPPIYVKNQGDYSYTAVNGAARNIRSLVQINEQPEPKKVPANRNLVVPTYTELTQGGFIDALKAGKTFSFTRTEEENCKSCSGRGVISRTSSGLSLEIQRETCSHCGGSGKTRITKEYTITW